jgi:hypothetical protein
MSLTDDESIDHLKGKTISESNSHQSKSAFERFATAAVGIILGWLIIFSIEKLIKTLIKGR